MTFRWKGALPFGALVLGTVALFTAGALEGPERFLMDARFRLLRRPIVSPVAVVGIDPASLKTLDVWPWPRGYHATVLENLLRSGARRVGFDVDFSSRSEAEEDAELVEAVAAAGGRIVLPVFHQRDRGEEHALARTAPLPALARHATLATINISPERDGLIRRYGAGRAPSRSPSEVSFAAALAEREEPRGGSFWIDYALAPESIPQISYLDVLTGHFDPALVRGRSIVVGATAVELGDQVAVPLSASLPGPLLQALAAASLHEGRALSRLPWPLTATAIVLLGLGLGPWLARTTWRVGLLATTGASAGLVAAATALQSRRPVLVDLAPLLVVLGGSYAIALVRRIDQQALDLLRHVLHLRRSQRLVRHVVENSFDAILTTDADGLVESFNPAAERMFGQRAGAVIGRSVAELIPGTEPGLGRLSHLGVHEVVGFRRDGAVFPLEISVGELPDDERPRRVAFLRDITARKAHQAELERQATHDSLTGLPNRDLLQRRFEEVVDASAPRSSALVLLDLDGFREVNDTLGHAVGDRLLQEIASRLVACLGHGDTVARLGGDEFAAFLPGATLEDAQNRVRTMARTLGQSFVIEGLSLHIEAGFGIAMHPDHGESATSLIRRADVALNVAKRDRVGTAVYAPEQDYNSVRQLTLKGDLRQALERGELVLNFQPQVSAGDGHVVGAETLVRWRHPRLGLVGPGEFIAVAEHTGLIRPLTQWVLDNAVRQAAAWWHRGRSIRVSVNLSARNLREDDLPDRVADLLVRYRLPAAALTLEITESVIMDDPRRALAVVTCLRALGVDISVDDFGTGYSSLAYLTRLPARELKLDKSFVVGLDRESSDLRLARSIIEMAHNLGIEAIAEGVETEAIWRLLREVGCDAGQGYLFSPPVPAEVLESWMEERADPGAKASVSTRDATSLAS